MFLLLRIAIAGNGFHVAGIRCRAVEYLGGHGGAAHDFAEVGVLEVAEACAEFAVRQKQVPQAGGSGLLLQFFNNGHRRPAVLGVFDLAMMGLFVRIDVGSHEIV